MEIRTGGLRKDGMGLFEFWTLISINIFTSSCNLGFGLKYQDPFHIVLGSITGLICIILLYRRYSK